MSKLTVLGERQSQTGPKEQSVENTEQLEFAYQHLPSMPNPECTVAVGWQVIG